MSCTLIWTRKVKGDIKDDRLSRVLMARFCAPYILNDCDVKYLEGLRDAGLKGVEVLIEAIHKYDEITLELEC